MPWLWLLVAIGDYDHLLEVGGFQCFCRLFVGGSCLHEILLGRHREQGPVVDSSGRERGEFKPEFHDHNHQVNAELLLGHAIVHRAPFSSSSRGKTATEVMKLLHSHSQHSTLNIRISSFYDDTH